VRVVIVEDQVLLRAGLARLFVDGGHEVVATLGDATTLAEVVETHGPDLVILDIRMPPTYTDEGSRAARDLKSWYPGTGVLLLSQHIETAHAVDLVGQPAFGYLLKDRVLEVEEFLETAARVAGGGSALDPKVAPRWSRQLWAVLWNACPSVSDACSSLWRRDSPTPPSPSGSTSACARSRRTYATSSSSSTYPRGRKGIAECSLCSPTFERSTSGAEREPLR
jgi:CheY-like chemotaxis protein